MQNLSPFWQGALAASLLSMGGHGLHWFIGSNAVDDASTARIAAVVMQVLVGQLGGLWIILRHVRSNSHSSLTQA